MKTLLRLAVSLAVVVVPWVALAAEPAPRPPANPLRNAYFGDLHVHTSYSLDSFVLGNRRSPADAYRFAKGEPVTVAGGTKFRLKAPLDFAAVTDHSEWMGELALCILDESDPLYEQPICRELREAENEASMPPLLAQAVGMVDGTPRRSKELCGDDGSRCRDRAKHVWQEQQRIANQFDEPGAFTTFIAYEWSLSYNAPFGMNHRNVIFRGTDVPDYAWSSTDDPRPERLWEWLSQRCTGSCEALAIPHNSNWSWGKQLALRNSDGSPFTREGLAQRARTEPLVEIFQHKGSSECMTGLGTNDELCDFELLWKPCSDGQKGVCPYEVDYVRNALKNGLVLDQRFGVNPFQYGIIASTDTHNATPGATEEDGYHGHLARMEGTADFRLGRAVALGDQQPIVTLANNPGGLAGVWAEENTRASIFDAMKRRETFGTSGTRIRLRFFGGWHYPDNLPTRPDLLKQAYLGGVPMGGNLTAAPAKDSTPKFLLWAFKDPNGADLQRIQIIKGWVDPSGETRERTYDAVCSNQRKPDPKTHRCPDDVATVDLATCAPISNGESELGTLWADPEFDPAERAFYYVRVLENPTCRWSTREALGQKQPLPTGVPTIVQERAWSSPVWYTPAGS